MANERKIALLGQPNSGKSTVFNTLTGAHQHVGNWPGKTVEKVEGEFTLNGTKYLVADLPGTYSLSANSDEEIVTRDYIASGGAELTCILADASQLERSLFMLADYAGINTPAMLVLTMTDVAKAQDKTVDSQKLSQKLGIPVVSLVAPDKKSYDGFYQALETALKAPKRLSADALTTLYKSGEQKEAYQKALSLVPAGGIDQYSPAWLAAKLLEGDSVVAHKVSAASDKAAVKAFLAENNDGSLYTHSWAMSKRRLCPPIAAAAAKNAMDAAAYSTVRRQLSIGKGCGEMQIVWIILAAAMIVGCFWSFVKRFTGKKTCCGTEKQPRIRAKKLSAPIGSLTMKIGGMRCENCRRCVTAALNALDGVAAKVSLDSARQTFLSSVLSAMKC